MKKFDRFFVKVIFSIIIYAPIMMGHGVCLYLGPDEIRSPSLMMVFIIISYLFNCTFWIYPLVLFGFIC